MTRRDLLAGLCAVPAAAAPSRLPSVQTVTGAVGADSLGLTLMHEHVVTDLRALAERSEGDYDREDAVRSCLPFLQEIQALGCRTLVEPTPMHIGRDVEALRRLAEASGLNIVCSTGIYGAAGQKFIPDYARTESADRLAQRYIREIEEGVERTGIKPGLIKTGVNAETPLPEIEQKLVRAAALASRETGVTMAAHTGPAAPVVEELRILDEIVLPRSSFIWVHAQNEKDHRRRIDLAREGLWASLDGIREQSAEWHLESVKELAYAGLLNRTLISQDAGWYRPGPERSSKYRGYAFLLEGFIPMMRKAGFSQSEIDQLLIRNPARALTGTPGL